MGRAEERAKEAAAGHAVAAYVRPGQTLALGTGSTAAYAVRAVRARHADTDFDCVASSRATEELARELGLPVREPRAGDRYDLMLDGADEVAPSLDLIKGGGGALLREKLLASRSARVVILVDPTKLVPALGSRAPVPVEVVPFARPLLEHDFSEAGWRPVLRRDGDGRAFRTDNGNEIVDLHPERPLADPSSFHAQLKSRVGVVETGLFVGIAERVVVGGDGGSVRELVRSGPTVR